MRHYILCSMRQFLHMALSGVHFVLYAAVFAHGTLGHTFCALCGSFCTWHSWAYMLCSMRQFLQMALWGVHFVLYAAVFVPGTLGRTLFLCSLRHFLYMGVHFIVINLSTFFFLLYLNISVKVSKLLHIGESFDSTPAVVGEEVNWTDNIGDSRKSKQEVQFSRVNLFVHQQNLMMCGIMKTKVT